MATFFGILFILIGINAILLVFSVNRTGQKVENSAKDISESSTAKVYPLDLLSSKYKKAI